MTIPEQVQNDYKRWHHFLEQEVQCSLSGSEKHTKEHCDRVLLFALLIAVTPAVRMTGWMWAMANGQRITTGTIVRHIRCPLITGLIW